MKSTVLLLMMAMLAGCGGSESGPGGVTAEESRALDDAAAMIDSRRLPPEALATLPPDAKSEPSEAAKP